MFLLHDYRFSLFYINFATANSKINTVYIFLYGNYYSVLVTFSTIYPIIFHYINYKFLSYNTSKVHMLKIIITMKLNE